MAITAFHNMKPFPQLMFSVFVILVSFLAFMLLSLVVAIPLFGMESLLGFQALTETPDPETITLLKYLQVVQAFGLFIVPPIILAYLFHGKIAEYLLLKKSVDGSTVLLVLVLMVVMAPLINLFGEWNNNMHLPQWLSGLENWMKNAEEKAALLTEAFLKVDTLGGLLFNLFMIAVLPALGEELLFRGVIQRIFTNMTQNVHWGIWISAILFSALHMQFFGFVPRLLLGALFGYLLIWSGSIWLPILAHFVNNALAVVAMYLIDKKMVSPEIENYGSAEGSQYLALISLFFVGLLLWNIQRQNKQNAISE